VAGRLFVGSSGFGYPEWKPSFYPAGTKPQEFLRVYAGRLPAVELNTTFRRLPSEEQLRTWAEQTPPAFRFTVKLGGRLGSLGTFAERVRVLGDRLGPLLVQLKEDRPRDDGFLELVLGSLDPELQVAFELRHESWDDPGVDAALDEAEAVRVGRFDGAAPFRYLRLREPPWDDAALDALAARVRPCLERGLPVYCFFNKGEHADHAPAGEPTAATALRFLERF
jgi:uncharacterized protein YecE (DUF72 family)